jgi:hypothetical protein
VTIRIINVSSQASAPHVQKTPRRCVLRVSEAQDDQDDQQHTTMDLKIEDPSLED